MVDVLLEFKGVIGTIIGVILTLIFTEIKKRCGKINLNINKINFEYFTQSSNSFGAETKEKVCYTDNPNRFEYSADMVFYNSSEVPRNLYDIKIILSTEKGQKFEHIPKDENSGNKIGVVNIDPYRLFKCSVSGQITNKEFEKLNRLGEVKRIYLKGLDHKNKIFKEKLNN